MQLDRSTQKWVFDILGFWLVVCAWAAFHHAYLATGLTIASYFFFGLIIFSLIKPRPWEASILFVLFVLGAMIYVLIFAAIYQHAGAIACEDPERRQPLCLNSIYYSTVVFTSLGFGDLLPLNNEGKWITSIQALLGMAYGATLMILILGRANWLIEDRKQRQMAEDASASRVALRDIQRQLCELQHNLKVTTPHEMTSATPFGGKRSRQIWWLAIVGILLLAANLSLAIIRLG